MSVQTYKTTDQFIEELKSFDDAKMKQLSAARDAARYVDWSAARDAARDAAWYAARYEVWYAAWYAARDAARSVARSAAWSAAWYADLAVLVKDKITAEQFEILTSPWTSCGLSLFVEADTRGDGGNEMTHDELLARIEHNQKHNTGWLDDNDFTEGAINPFYAALLAVVELHGPSNTGGCGDGECCGEFDEQDHCIICREDYPCPTIQAIEKELGVGE